MNQYQVTIYNDEPNRQMVEKIAMIVNIEDKDLARKIGLAVAEKLLPLVKTAVEVDFRKELK